MLGREHTLESGLGATEWDDSNSSDNDGGHCRWDWNLIHTSGGGDTVEDWKIAEFAYQSIEQECTTQA